MSDLIGRTAERRVGEQALSALRRGDPGFLVVAGEPGIGKTRLVSDLLAAAERRRYLTLSGSAGELERDLPFAVIVDALDSYVASLEPAALEGMRQEAMAHLGGILPSLTPSGPPAIALSEERYRAYRAVGELLGALASRRPLVLALDDLHWADPASIELVSYLLRHPPVVPVLVVLALRPRQAPPRLRSVLDAAGQDGKARWIEPGPLSLTEAAALLGERAPSARHRGLYQESGGNPFYLLALGRAAESGRPGAHNKMTMTVADSGVPPGVLSAIGAELALLSPEAAVILRAAAVVGDPFEVDLAAEAAGLPEEHTFSPLDELLEAALIQPTDSPRQFRFRHPIVRHAVYEDAGRGWRLAAHRRAAAALAARGAPPSARAHHVERSARSGEEDAIALLTEAGRSVITQAPATATQWFAAALRLLPEGGAAAGQRLALLAARATALASLGRLEEARAALVETLTLVPPEHSGLRVQLTAFCAAVEHLLGRHDAAGARLRLALDQLRDPRSPEAVTLHIELAFDAFWASDFEAEAGWGTRAVELARELELPVLVAAGMFHAAYASYGRGRISEAGRHLDEAAALVDAASDEALASRVDVCYWVGLVDFFLGRFDAASRHIERVISVARATGQGAWLNYMVACLAWLNLARGRLESAAELAEAAVESCRLAATTQDFAFALAVQAWAASLSGERDRAEQAARESVELCQGLEPSVASAAAGWVVAAALVELGEPARAVELMLERAGGPDLPLLAGPTRCVGYEILTRAELARGRVDEADDWSRRGGAIVEGLDLPVVTAPARRAPAEVALARDDLSEAVVHANASAEAADAVGAPLDAGRARMLAGRALARAGESDRAADELRRASEQLSACGAKRLMDEAAAELRRLGRRLPTRRTPDDQASVLGLSARQSQVAQLVGQGKTNRDIATELFLSERTVENHVAHIFAKLGTSSRAALAAAVTSRLQAHEASPE